MTLTAAWRDRGGGEGERRAKNQNTNTGTELHVVTIAISDLSWLPEMVNICLLKCFQIAWLMRENMSRNYLAQNYLTRKLSHEILWTQNIHDL